MEDTFWNFHRGLKAGATYEVFLQSMPAKNQNPGKNIESFRITTPEGTGHDAMVLLAH